MNIFASLLVFFGGLLLIYLLTAVIKFLTRGRGGMATGFFLPVLLVVLLGLGVSFYLDNNGDVVPGTVVAKNEEINVYDTGTYMRFLNIDVQFQPLNTGYPTTIRMPVNAALFDQLHNGQAVQVRYINPAGLFLFSRLKQQTTFSLIPWNVMWLILLIVSFVGLAYLWSRKPRRRADTVVEPGSEPAAPPSLRRPIAFVLFIVWLGAVLFTVFQPVLMPVSSDSWQTTTAQLKAIRRYIEVTESRRTSRTIPLVQPFAIVQFTFTPQGLSDSVTGVDVVDSATSTLPEQGSHLTIKYPADNPRAAVIVDAARTHYWKNPLGALGLVLASVLALGLIWLLVRLIWRIFTRGLVAIVARR